MARTLALVGVALVTAVAALLFLLPSRTANGVEPATIMREREDIGVRASATLSAPEVAEAPPEAEPEPPRAEAEPSTVDPGVAPAHVRRPAGTVEGRVVFVGEVPTLEPLHVWEAATRGCCEPGDSVDTTDRSLLVDDDHGIANVVVTIKVEGEAAAPLLDPVYLDQAGCRFEPHVSVIPAGTRITFRNLDRTAHNLHTYAFENEPFNQTLVPRAEYRQELASEECIRVRCDIHPWMGGWLVVVDTPYFAVTDRSGRFEIRDLPAGKHEVDVWHERLGKGKGTATVSTDDKPEVIEIRMMDPKRR